MDFSFHQPVAPEVESKGKTRVDCKTVSDGLNRMWREQTGR